MGAGVGVDVGGGFGVEVGTGVAGIGVAVAVNTGFAAGTGVGVCAGVGVGSSANSQAIPVIITRASTVIHDLITLVDIVHVRTIHLVNSDSPIGSYIIDVHAPCMKYVS